MAELAAPLEGKHRSLPRGCNPHFLIVTNDTDLHQIVDDAVTRLSCTAAFVRSGCDAMASARSRSLSLVLLDQYLPDVAGLEVARAISRYTPSPPFVLIGSAITTSITVEAMKLGAFTVLEKPVGVSEIVTTIRSAVIESRPALASHLTTLAHGAPGSVSARWARHVLKACEAGGDLKTLGAWASFAGLSYSSLCESCRLIGIQPSVARDLARVLRAVVQSRVHDCRVQELLDISDRRTLKTLMTRAALDPEAHGTGVSVEQFLALQRFVPPNNAGLAVLRSIVLS